MAMSDEEVKLIHDLKVEQVREQGETDMQIRLKEERR